MKPTIIVSALAGVLALSACGTTRIVEMPAEAAEPAKEAQVETTEAEAEDAEFLAWFLASNEDITNALRDSAGIGDLMENGDFMAAADLAEDSGETFTDLYMDAPEDGTPLSVAANEMFSTCGAAFTDSATALHAMDADAMTDVVSDINECNDDMDAFTDAMNDVTEGLD